MRKLSTRCMNDLNQKEKPSREEKNSPRKQTIDLLRQFARAYQVEAMKRQELCGFVLN